MTLKSFLKGHPSLFWTLADLVPQIILSGISAQPVMELRVLLKPLQRLLFTVSIIRNSIFANVKFVFCKNVATANDTQFQVLFSSKSCSSVSVLIQPSSTYWIAYLHGSYNLENILNFSSHLKKSWSWLRSSKTNRFLNQVVKSPWNSLPCLCHTIFWEIIVFLEKNLAPPSVRTCRPHR